MIFKVNEEIVLRPLCLEDAKELFDLVCKNRPSLAKWLYWVDSIKTIDDEVSFINQCIQNMAEKTAFEMGIFFKQTNPNDKTISSNSDLAIQSKECHWKLIGMCGLVEIKLSCGKVGYWLDKDYRGKGIVTNALKTLRLDVAKNFNLTELQMHVLPENAKSIAVANRSGFITDNVVKRVTSFGKEVDALLFILTCWFFLVDISVPVSEGLG